MVFTASCGFIPARLSSQILFSFFVLPFPELYCKNSDLPWGNLVGCRGGSLMRAPVVSSPVLWTFELTPFFMPLLISSQSWFSLGFSNVLFVLLASCLPC